MIKFRERFYIIDKEVVMKITNFAIKVSYMTVMLYGIKI